MAYRLLRGLSKALVALNPRGLGTRVSPGVSAGTAKATAYAASACVMARVGSTRISLYGAASLRVV